MIKRGFIFFSVITLILPLFGQEATSDEKKILSLIECFNDEDPFVNGKAIQDLASIGEAAVNHLIKSLQSENDTIRWCSAIALGKIAPEGVNAIPFLAEALKDKNSDVRWCSAIALGKFKGKAKSAVPELLNLLNDDDRDVRWAAYISLSKINKEATNKAPEFSTVVDKLEELTPKLMSELKVPGVSISVIKDYKLKWSKSFGISDAVLQTQVNSKTMFEACSMSKPVFAYLVLKLVEQGRLDLDKPLSNYQSGEFISDEEDYSKQITARMILAHTSGMPNWRQGGEEREGPLPVYFKPGTRFNYSGEGFYYLQKVVEHITKESLETYAKLNLFDKLGFESTSFVWAENLNPQIATGHDTSGNRNERKRYTHANAAYTLYTTSDEYARFIIEIMKPDRLKDQALSDKMLKEMLAHQVRVDVRDVIDRPGRSLGLFAYRGLGWGIDSTITGDIVYHSGANQTGFRCYSQFNLQEGSGIVIMTNAENGNELWRRLISVVGDL
jgi:CubicO group peptidase (beta-lactamase class C family)